MIFLKASQNSVWWLTTIPEPGRPWEWWGVGVERGWEGFWEQGLSVLLLFYYEGQQRLQGQFLGRSQ